MICKENATFFSSFPMFVPSLSWSNDQFYYSTGARRRFITCCFSHCIEEQVEAHDTATAVSVIAASRTETQKGHFLSDSSDIQLQLYA
jgi:hypothetical protein